MAEEQSNAYNDISSYNEIVSVASASAGGISKEELKGELILGVGVPTAMSLAKHSLGKVIEKYKGKLRGETERVRTRVQEEAPDIEEVEGVPEIQHLGPTSQQSMLEGDPENAYGYGLHHESSAGQPTEGAEGEAAEGAEDAGEDAGEDLAEGLGEDLAEDAVVDTILPEVGAILTVGTLAITAWEGMKDLFSSPKKKKKPKPPLETQTMLQQGV